jgi:hypothetical protein
MTIIRRKWFIGLILAVGLTAIPVFAHSNSQNEPNQDTQKTATVSAGKGDTKGATDKPATAVPSNTVQKTTPKPIISSSPIIVGDNGTSTKPDNSYLISYLTGKKFSFDSKNENWYNTQKASLDSTHQNNLNAIQATYQDEVNSCIMQYGSSSAAEACAQYAQSRNQQSRTTEINRYNQQVAQLNNEWDNYKTWSGIIQNLIDYLKAGNKPDANFYDLYYKIPFN